MTPTLLSLISIATLSSRSCFAQEPTFQIFRDRNQLELAVAGGYNSSLVEETFDVYRTDIVFNDGATKTFPYFNLTGFGDATLWGAAWNRVDVRPWLDAARKNPNGTPQLAIRVCGSKAWKCGNGLTCHQGTDINFGQSMLGWGAWMGRTASSFQISILVGDQWENVGTGTNEGFFAFLIHPTTNSQGFTKLRIGTGECWGGANTNLDGMVFLPRNDQSTTNVTRYPTTLSPTPSPSTQTTISFTAPPDVNTIRIDNTFVISNELGLTAEAIEGTSHKATLEFAYRFAIDDIIATDAVAPLLHHVNFGLVLGSSTIDLLMDVSCGAAGGFCQQVEASFFLELMESSMTVSNGAIGRVVSTVQRITTDRVAGDVLASNLAWIDSMSPFQVVPAT